MSTTQLKKHLFNNYGGFSDKRIKDLKKSSRFKIDDFGQQDTSERFCHIFVDVIDNTTNFVLCLANNAPISPEIEELISSNGGELTQAIRNHIYIQLTPRDHEFVKLFASEIRKLVSPDREYEDSNWKWLCPRTAESLRRFAKVLERYKGGLVDEAPPIRKGFFF